MQELLYASPSLMNFALLLFISSAHALFRTWVCYLCDFSRTEGNGIYSTP